MCRGSWTGESNRLAQRPSLKMKIPDSLLVCATTVIFPGAVFTVISGSLFHQIHDDTQLPRYGHEARFGKPSKAAAPQPEPAEEPELEPLATLPPTPVFPSNQAMSLFLQSYARMLQHVKTGTVVGKGRKVGVDHSHDALVSGDSLAAAGDTVLERVHLGLGALLHHPQHGVQGGTVWGRKEEAVERCLEELEKDVEHMRDAHEKAPPATTLNLATAHCLDAAKMISKL
ncbi:unnamed protein product [Closterium sp. Yama58-4]|nr:unnamed protein product [Closterium sp. Yama58-4]